MNRRPPRFYFSLRSPYSWLAHHDLFDRHPDLAERLTWAPFWEPDAGSSALLAEAGGEFPYRPMSRAKHLYVLQDVRRLAADRGLRVAWPIDRQPHWEVPHLGYLAAARLGAAAEYLAACYRARWQEGRDICDRATVAAVAKELGLPPAELSGAADDLGLRAEGTRALLEVHRDGVFGVPFFVHAGAKFWGVDRLEPFAATVRADAPTGTARPGVVRPGTEPGFDDGHAGGCG